MAAVLISVALLITLLALALRRLQRLVEELQSKHVQERALPSLPTSDDGEVSSGALDSLRHKWLQEMRHEFLPDVDFDPYLSPPDINVLLSRYLCAEQVAAKSAFAFCLLPFAFHLPPTTCRRPPHPLASSRLTPQAARHTPRCACCRPTPPPSPYH